MVCMPITSSIDSASSAEASRDIEKGSCRITMLILVGISSDSLIMGFSMAWPRWLEGEVIVNDIAETEADTPIAMTMTVEGLYDLIGIYV